MALRLGVGLRKQMDDVHFQRIGKFAQAFDGYVDLRRFKPLQMPWRDSRNLGQGFLRQPATYAQSAYVYGDSLAYGTERIFLNLIHSGWLSLG